MNHADRRRWMAAHTVNDLGHLTAEWLEGSLASQPGYSANCGPDEETLPVVPILARLNRRGWLTYGSQPGWGPGVGYDGSVWTLRAGVSGFTNPQLADKLTEAAAAAGLLLVRHANTADRPRGWIARLRWRPEIPVSTRDRRPCSSFGRHWSRRDVSRTYGDHCSPEAIAALTAAVQLTIVDPEWGRDDLLWATLDAALPALTPAAPRPELPHPAS